jgi:hypothetical protein
MPSSVSSAAYRPTICTPTGQPSGDGVPGTLMAGAPGTSDSAVNGAKAKIACALLATGATNRMAARSLGVTERTVATHVEHLLTKLGRQPGRGRGVRRRGGAGAGVPRTPLRQVRCVVNQRSWAGAETAKASPT